MRTYALLAALVSAALLSIAAAPPATAVDTMPKVFWTVHATSHAGEFVFEPEVLIAPTVPTVMNVTVVNDDPLNVFHTFTIRSATSDDLLVDLSLDPGVTLSVQFILWDPTQIEVGSRNETAEDEGGAVYFFCLPHEAVGMVGTIVVGGLQQEAPEPHEKGVFLRAYWIGLLGMAGTLVLIVFSYFVIKGSSRHFRDHKEHVRRGGP